MPSSLRRTAGGDADDGPVGLELGERGLEDLAGHLAPDLGDEVDGHVVGRPEARPQRVGAGGRQAPDANGSMPRAHCTTAWPLDVDAAPGRAPVSWVYSAGVMSTCASTLNLTSFSSTTVRAGMLMPSASVSVAKTARMRAR
jgi:hypothetical protein